MDANTSLAEAVTNTGRGLRGWYAPRFDLVTDGANWLWHRLNTWQRVVALGVLALCIAPWVYLVVAELSVIEALILLGLVPLVTGILPAAFGRWINLVWVVALLLLGAGGALVSDAFANGAAVLFLLVAGAIIVFFLWVIFCVHPPASVEKDKTDLLATPKSQRAVKAALSHADGVYAGDVGGEPLFTSLEDRACVIGPPGTGKTTFMVNQLLRWAETQRPFVCLDIKPEIEGLVREQLVELGYRIRVFNPTQTGHDRYNPFDDIEGPEGLGELAASLIPSEGAEHAVFNESARDLLDAMASHLKAQQRKKRKGQGATLPAVRSLLESANDPAALLGQLSNSPDKAVRGIARGLSMTGANERLMGSIIATFRSNLRFLRYPNISESVSTSDFSLKDLTTDRPVALFLQFEEAHRDTTKDLMSAMVAHLMRYLIIHTDRSPVLLLLDEIGNAPAVPGLIQKLNTIRSRKLPTWLYWQSLEQMQRYGAKAGEGANIILGACDLQMVFRLNDNASAEWVSQRIGTVDRLIKSRSVSEGTVTDSRSLREEPVIFSHELQQLKQSEVIGVYREHRWRGMAKPYHQLL